MKRILFALACLLAIDLGTAEAKQCSMAFYRDIAARSTALENGGAACKKALRWKTNISEICSKCRGTLRRISTLESILRRNRSCFEGRARRDIESLMAARDELRFMRRGCGY